MPRFDDDYELGKKSEILSLKDINNFFNTELKLDNNQYSHFDYYNDDFKIELKTRPSIHYNNGDLWYGYTKNIDSLYFDSPKLKEYIKNKKNGDKRRYIIVWKLVNRTVYWEFNENENEYYIENQFRDCGKGFRQDRDVVNVRAEFIKSF